MSYAIKQLENLPFDNLIGGPMTAAISAQSQAAAETISFIKSVGFKPVKDDNTYDPELDDDGITTLDNKGNADMGEVRNVVFTYEKSEGGESQTATLKVPVLTIVPIPTLRIDEMNIDFMAKISEVRTNQYKSASAQAYSSRFGASYRSWWSPVRASFSASYSSRHSSSHASSSRYSSEMTMNVNVRAVQDELPAGMSRVLGILEGLIKEEQEA